MRSSIEHRARRHPGVVRWTLRSIATSLVLGAFLSAPQQTVAQPSPASPADGPLVETPSPLSYGAITARVKEGITTQADLVSLFGGPNIATLDSDGTETWVYERTTSETSTSGQETGTTVTHSISTLTVIIKFNPDKTVREYSARASHF